jgi:signal transduction histidine kinase
MVRLAMLHVPILLVVGVTNGEELVHVGGEVSLIAVFSVAGLLAATRAWQATCTSVALLLSSSLLVHFTDGLIESHFHFFVILPLIALYQDWRPFLTAIGFVAFHHGIVGYFSPNTVYNHPAAIANPVLWAFIHAGYILALVVVLTFHWRSAERSEAAMRGSEHQLQRSNRMLQAVSESNDTLVRAKDEDTLLREVCRIVVEAGGYSLAWVGFAVNDESKTIRPVAQWGPDKGYVTGLSVTWADTERGSGPAGTAVRTRTPVALRNIATDPAFEPWRDRALERGYMSTIAVPLLHGEKVLGVIAVYADEIAAFDVPEVEILQRFADDLAYGIVALRTRERQEEAEAQLREMLRSKDRFVETIAHELRTPLAAVVGFAQVLQEEGSGLTPDDRAEMMQMLIDGGLDLTNIVDDLLVAAKAEAGTLTVARVRVDLRAQATQVLENWGQEAAGQIEFTGPTVHTIGDPARVRQILRNLISNALRYGGEQIQICVDSDASTGQVMVIDNGIGVPPEEQEAIFEPYRRAHNSPSLTASMGLGLSISRQLAQLMDGDLTYRRDPGKSIFALTLPISDPFDDTALSVIAAPSSYDRPVHPSGVPIGR